MTDQACLEPTVARIVGVAVIHDGVTYTMGPPNRHHNVIHHIVKTRGGAAFGQPRIEGFIDERGVFLDRKQAMQRAVQTGQLRRREGAQYYQGPELYSEDLW